MNPEFQTFGRLLIFAGIVIFLIGLLFLFGDKIPLLGKLPGDFHIKGKSFTFYFPLTSSIIISIIISLILYLFRK